MSGDLVAFLAARLDEDEAAAKNEDVYFAPYPETIGEFEGWLVIQEERVLREVEAKRATLELHHEGTPGWCRECGGREFPCPTLCHLAAGWAAHPDYRPEWAPSRSLPPDPGHEEREQQEGHEGAQH